MRFLPRFSGHYSGDGNKRYYIVYFFTKSIMLIIICFLTAPKFYNCTAFLFLINMIFVLACMFVIMLYVSIVLIIYPQKTFE